MFKDFRSKAILLWGALAAAAALLAAGCGSSSSEASPQAQDSLTKAQFIRRGDAICEKDDETRNTEITPYVKKGSNTFSRPEKEKVVPKSIATSFREDVEKLGALAERAPKGDEAKVQRIVNVFDATVKGVEEKPGSILAGAGPSFAEVEKLTAEYGFTVCGRS